MCIFQRKEFLNKCQTFTDDKVDKQQNKNFHGLKFANFLKRKSRENLIYASLTSCSTAIYYRILSIG